MNPNISDFLSGRIEEITQNLFKTNGKYALAVERSKKLMENIDPVIHHGSDITISLGDCINFQEFLEHEFTRAAIIQRELYRQGYMDCVKLLKTLEILA